MVPLKESFADWLDHARCAEILRECRWPSGQVDCVFCQSDNVNILEKYKTYFFRYECLDCGNLNGHKTTFNDKTGSIFEDSKISLAKWFYTISLLQKKISTNQIANELQVDGNTARRMVGLIRGSIFLSIRLDDSSLNDEVEIDEAYVTAGSKGNDESRTEARESRKRGLKKRGRGTYETDKTPIVGFTQRAGNIHFEVTKNGQTVTVQPLIEHWVAPQTTIYTDEYNIYNFLDRSENYTHLTVCHSKGEYALDLDGDGINETHCNTQEGVWSLLRPWIRPHRGINKMYLPLYVAPCEFFYNRRKKTPVQQIREVITLAASWIGKVASDLCKVKCLWKLGTV